MLDKVRRRLTYANVMSSIAFFGVLGGGAYAAATIDSSDIKRNAVLSKHIKNQQVRSNDIGRNQVKPADASSAVEPLWAAVEADGNLLRDDGATAAACVNNPCEGFYGVTFERNVDRCAWQATPGSVDGNLNNQPRMIAVAQNLTGSFFENKNQVLVSTFLPNGTDTNQGFVLTVFC